jgi:hypothetical protein
LINIFINTLKWPNLRRVNLLQKFFFRVGSRSQFNKAY